MYLCGVGERDRFCSFMYNSAIKCAIVSSVVGINIQRTMRQDRQYLRRFLKTVSWMLHSEAPGKNLESGSRSRDWEPRRHLFFWAPSWLGWKVWRRFYSCLSGSILFKWMAMEPKKISEKQEEILSILEEKFPRLPPRDDIISVLQETQFSAQGEWLCPPALSQMLRRDGLWCGVLLGPRRWIWVWLHVLPFCWRLWKIFRHTGLTHLEADSVWYLEVYQVPGFPGTAGFPLRPSCLDVWLIHASNGHPRCIITWNPCAERVLFWECGRSNVKHNEISSIN